jgi:MFS family permease
VALALFSVTALATTPSPLYRLYQQRDGLSLISITVVYAGYAVGIVFSLFLIGHVSDWYGRRVVLLPALVCAAFSAVIFIFWPSFSGILIARIVTGLALGAAVATVTAYMLELDAARNNGTADDRGLVLSRVANTGGLGLGALISGILAQYLPGPLVVPYIVCLVALVLSIAGVALTPETRPRPNPLPRYHPQRIAVPPETRSAYFAALLGVVVVFAAFGLFAGLSGTILVVSFGDPSVALAGLAVFITFGGSVVVQVTVGSWPSRRLMASGVTGIILGLAMVVTAVWARPSILALFLVGGLITGAGGGAIFRGAIGVVTALAPPDARAGPLAGLFLAAYVGLSGPVIGIGITLQHISVRVTLLVFALAIGSGTLAALPVLMRPIDPTSQ